MFARRLWLHVLANGVVTLEVALLGTHVEVVRVHMLAGLNGGAGKANDLVVTAHGLPGLNGARGHFVAGWNKAFDRHALHAGTAHELGTRNDHVIGRMKSNKNTHGLISKKLVRQPQYQAGHVSDDGQAA